MEQWLQIVEAVRERSPAGAALLEAADPEVQRDLLVLTFQDRTAYDRVVSSPRGLQMIEGAVKRVANLRSQCRYLTPPGFDPLALDWRMIERASDAELKPLWRDRTCGCGNEVDTVVPSGTDLRWCCQDCLRPLLVQGLAYRSRWFGVCRVEEVTAV